MSSNELFGEMRPGSSHFWNAFAAKTEMMCFLIIFNPIRFKDWLSLIRIIPKFAFSSAFKISGISTKFIMSSYLIQSILISKGLITSKIYNVSFFFECFPLFSSEILTPTPGVIPMR